MLLTDHRPLSIHNSHLITRSARASTLGGTIRFRILDCGIRRADSRTDFELPSPDYLIGPGQDIRGNDKADLLGGFQINHQLELRRLLDRKIGGLGAFEDLVYVGGRAMPEVGKIWRIDHEAADLRDARCAIN